MYSSGVRQRPPGIYYDVVGDAWTLFQQQWQTWVGAGMVLAFIYAILYVPIFLLALSNGGGPGQTPDFASFMEQEALSILIGCVFYVLAIGMIQMGIKQIRGEAISVGQLFSAFPSFIPLIGTYILFTLAMMVGCVLCIFPGLSFYGGLIFAGPLVADKRMPVIEAFKTSWTGIGGFGKGFSMFALLFLLGLVVYAGIFACVVGIFASGPIAALSLALHYTYYFPEPGQTVQPPVTQAYP
jgi:hypothetical protein